MAPEQAEGHPVEGQADLYALALVLYEALSGVNPIRAGGAAATARRVGTRLPPLARLRRDLPREVCAALDRAVLPRPEDRGTLQDLRLALDDAVDGAARRAGPVAGDPAETRLASPVPARDRPRRGAPALTRRAASATATAALVAASLAAVPDGLAPGPGAPLAAAAGAALAVLLLPRLGWVLAAGGVVAWLTLAGLPGAAVLVLAAAVPTAILLPRDGLLWPLPAGAPLLGLAGAALAWPAVAGQARDWTQRGALGALGLWWLVLAEALAGPRLLLGDAPGTAAPSVFEASATRAVTDVLVPIVSSGRPADRGAVGRARRGAPAARARAQPRARRRRRHRLGRRARRRHHRARRGAPLVGRRPEPRGLVLGALAAGAIALLGAAARAPATTGGVSP